MALKDRFRRALSRSENRSTPSSISTSSTHSPPQNEPSPSGLTSAPLPRATTSPPTNIATPTLTLTKTSSRLSRILTGGGRGDKRRDKEEKKLEEWAKQDEREWESPSKKYPGKKSQPHQETLRAFEWRWRGSIDRRRSSAQSGVSPGCSRNASVDENTMPTLNRVLSGGSARRKSSLGPSERGGSRGGDGLGHLAHVETVVEE